MQSFIPVLLMLFILLAFMTPSYANHINNPKNRQPVAAMQGVYVQTNNVKTLQTDNDIYLLIDKKELLTKRLENETGIMMQSFRTCLSGYIVVNHQMSYERYPEIFVVEQLCKVSQ